MRKLSQRAWNNVLIFSMLTLILILNWENFTGTGSDEPESPFSPHDVILSVHIDQLMFERVGTGWRVQGPENLIPAGLNSDSISAIISAWQQLQLQPIDSAPVLEALSQPDHIVRLFVAGRSEPITLYIAIVQSNAYVMANATAYQLQSPTITMLIPQP